MLVPLVFVVGYWLDFTSERIIRAEILDLSISVGPDMYNILSISRNTRLLLQRNDSLALAGFRVISPRTPEEAPFLALQQDVDAVVIGHSVEPSNRATLIEAIRKLCPACIVLFVYASPDTEGEPLADVSLDVNGGTEPLIRALRQRLPRQASAAD
jgi:hypothetical protein